jgi:hypothetical protein
LLLYSSHLPLGVPNGPVIYSASITKLQWSHRRLNSATNFKNGKEQQIFFGFSNFETRAKGNSKPSKIFLDFSNTKLKIKNKANQN